MTREQQAERYARAMRRTFKGVVDTTVRTSLVLSNLYRTDRPGA